MSTRPLSFIKNINNTAMRYLLVGGGSYVIEIGVLFSLKKLGLSNLASVAISFWIGLISSFLLQKFITFKSSSPSKKHLGMQIILYLSLVAFNYVFTLLLVGTIGKAINVLIIRTLAIICTTVWNYYFYKIHIFSDSKSAANR